MFLVVLGLFIDDSVSTKLGLWVVKSERLVVLCWMSQMGDPVDLFPSLLYMGWQPSCPSLRTAEIALVPAGVAFSVF